MAPQVLPRLQPRAAFAALLAAVFLQGCNAFLVGIDIGSQYLKACVIAPGKPFEVVHNQHSKRKTPTAVSYFEKVRTFGDDAIASGVRGASKTPMFFPLQLGRNLTAVAGDELPWLPQRFYPYSLGRNASGSVTFNLGDDESYTVEEVTAHLLGFTKKLSIAAADNMGVTETIITIPSAANWQQRRALLAAAKIAKLPRVQLIHETSAAALQRALDLDLSGANGTQNTSTILFYNMGARHVETCVVGYTGVKLVGGKSTVAMDVLGCGVSEDLGGHQVDLLIAEKMLATFLEKFPKLADITSSVRAMKKLEKQALDTKHVLSANKDALFRVESLFEDTDFSHPITREGLEQLSATLFASFSQPIETALSSANLTLGDIDAVEMIGGGWRIPRIQSLLSEYLEAQRPQGMPALNLSQHVNGDEAMATGAAFYGANWSISFRTKTIYFTDATPHGYALLLSPLNLSQPHEEDWQRGVELFPAHSKLRSKKTVKLNVTFDLKASLIEDGHVVAYWELPGIHEASVAKAASPLISLKFELDPSGVVQLAKATAIFDEEEQKWVPTKVNSTSAVNASANATSAPADAEEAGEESEAAGAEGNVSGDAADADAAADAAAMNDSNDTNTTSSGMWVTKKVKRKVNIEVLEAFEGLSPRPLSVHELAEASERLAVMDAADGEVKAIEAAKNALEGFVYDARGKLSDDAAYQEVSTEEMRSKIIENLTAMEEWLYEDEAQQASAVLLDEKLQELRELVGPIARRAFELEQRPQLPELVEKVMNWVNATLEHVRQNMTWVEESQTQGVVNKTSAFSVWWEEALLNQSSLALTDEPAYYVNDVKRSLEVLRSEAQRLTKIQKKVDYGYGSGYGGYGGGYGGYGDPKMREFYEQMYRNFSNNGTNYSDWFKNFSNFSNFKGWNDSDYMRSYYEHAAENFSSQGAGNSSSGEQEPDAKAKTEL